MDRASISSAIEPPKWRWLNDAEVENYAKAHGSNTTVLTELLVSAGKCAKAKGKGGKEYNSCRSQMSIKGKKYKIHNLRLWMSIRLARSHAAFRWSSYASHVLDNCPDANQAGEKLKSLFEEMDSADLQRALDDTFRTHKENANVNQSQEEEWCRDPGKVGAGELPEDASRETTSKANVAAKPERYDVATIFLSDLIQGMGLQRELVEETFRNLGEHELGLESRLREIEKDFGNRKSTFTQYVRIKNFFLVWLNQRYPTLFKESGMLLADEASVYEFLRELEERKISQSSFEPAIVHVLAGDVSYECQPTDRPFSFALGKKIVSALSELYVHQQTLLNKHPIVKLRDSPTLKAWEKNLSKSDRRYKLRQSGDPQATVFQGDCPLEAKERQSMYLLELDTPVSTRNRALGLAQIFSISRFDEASKWTFKHLHMKKYSHRLPHVGSQSIIPLYFQQGEHKTAHQDDSRIPDQRVIVRRKEWQICPQSAIAYYFFERLVLFGEKPIDLSTPAGTWPDVYIFRSDADRCRPVDQRSVYAQRKELFDVTDTGLAGCVNHFYRKLGSWLGRLSELTIEEVRSVGLWDAKELDKHYMKYQAPSTCAKLSGFRSALHYNIPRARISIDHFLAINDDVDPKFFISFMPFLDDSSVESSVMAFLREQINTNRNVFMAMQQIRLVFFQDVYHYYSFNKNLRIFSAEIFTKYESTFVKWLSYCKEHIYGPDAEDSCFKERGSEAISDDLGSEWKTRMEETTRSLAEAADMTNSKIDRLLSLAQINNLKEIPKQAKDHPNDAGDLIKEGYVFSRITKLRPLKEMTMADVVQEWTMGSVYLGVETGPLSDFDKARVSGKVRYNKEIKSSLLIRRTLFEFFRSKLVMLGSEDGAYMTIEDMRRKLGKPNKSCSLDFLYRYIRNHKRSQQGATSTNHDSD